MPNLFEDEENRKQEYEKEYDSPTIAGELERLFIMKDTLDKG